MRRAFRGNLVKCEDVLYGVDLGADYCAEHEWGIDRLNKSFGINTEDVGLNKRLQTKEALQTVYDSLNQGQQKKIVKDEKVKALFDRYGVEYSE